MWNYVAGFLCPAGVIVAREAMLFPTESRSFLHEFVYIGRWQYEFTALLPSRACLLSKVSIVFTAFQADDTLA